MISLTVGRAWIDRMLVVKAAAHRVALNDLITHDDGRLVDVAEKSICCGLMERF
jgi:hypothetical protein